MEQFIDLLKTHSPIAIMLGIAIIFVVGVLKYFKLFDKITNKDLRKFIFLIVDVALSFGASAIYLAISHIGFVGYLAVVGEVFTVCLVEYAIYENVGLRKALQLAGNYIVKKVAGNLYSSEIEKLKKSEEETKQD